MAFWKKFYKSKYTGAEIDAAVAKAGTVPAVTEADAGKALVVDSEGKVVPGEVGGLDIKTLDIVNSGGAGIVLIGFLGSVTTDYTTITITNLPNNFIADIKALFDSLNGAENLALKVVNSTQGFEMSTPPVFASVMYGDSFTSLVTDMGVMILGEDTVMWSLSITLNAAGTSGSIIATGMKATPRSIN